MCNTLLTTMACDDVVVELPFMLAKLKVAVDADDDDDVIAYLL